MARPNTLPSPEVRRERARKGALARNSLDSYVKQIVERAPELTDEHISKLRTLLRPVSGGAAE
ncbi:hypothetical protein ACWD4F_02285 [Streptomyces aureus]